MWQRRHAIPHTLFLDKTPGEYEDNKEDDVNTVREAAKYSTKQQINKDHQKQQTRTPTTKAAPRESVTSETHQSLLWATCLNLNCAMGISLQQTHYRSYCKTTQLSLIMLHDPDLRPLLHDGNKTTVKTMVL